MGKALSYRFLNKKLSSVGSSKGEPQHLLVLLHGWLGSSLDWEPVAALLPSRVTVLAIDLPGHGDSPAWSVEEISFERVCAAVFATVENATEALKECHTTIVAGYSLGGRIALQLARAYPSKLSGLILLSAHTGLTSEVQRAERSAHDRQLALQVASASGDEISWEHFVRRWYDLPIFRSLAEKPELREEIVQRRLLTPPIHPDLLLSALSLGNQPPLLGEENPSSNQLKPFPVPTLLVAGEKDDKYRELFRDVSTITGSPVVTLDSAGHAVLAEAPAGVARAIGDWIASL
jgi:2-succinyl-6-hydroxy-2,4-cyclohexadiene-1-carboxylate synthase